jgi:aspartyl-tRNA synthetase
VTDRTLCGTPRAGDAGKEITVCGWVHRRRDHGGLIFIDVRDYSGILQVVINPASASQAYETARDVRLEWVVGFTGELVRRSAENVNPTLETGEVELHAESCVIFAAAKTPPFQVNEDTEVDEQLRLRYRYLDLRRRRMQRNLRSRAHFIAEIRKAMVEQGFIELETPMMIRPTPEGARDYLVPSRLFPGSAYALPQSPQLYKQLSMVAGFDRYFQIARCMRDEDLRADRQPEFTQLDMEMSFVEQDDVFAVLETAIPAAWHACEFRGGPLRVPFPRITWSESMERYGVDKPDTRFEMFLVDLTDLLRGTTFRVFADVITAGGIVKAICVKGGDDITRSEIEGALTEVAKTGKARGLAYLWKRASGWESGIAKFFSAEELDAIGEKVDAAVGDLVLMVADKPPVAAASLGALRNHLGETRHLYDEQRIDMLWVTDFPMFERNDESGELQPAHHPFTMYDRRDEHLFDSDPLAVRSLAYDLVVNGREVGSGSIRITDPNIQRRVFAAIGIDAETANRRFGFLLRAFEYGVPPHGGCAPGIDRLVMEGLGEENIRDVIAFPKNQQAQEPMTDAPSPVDGTQLRELGLQLTAEARAAVAAREQLEADQTP